MRDSADPVRRRWGRNTRHTLTYGYDEATVGSHAGISDTSQMLFIRPTGVRKDQIKPWGGPQFFTCTQS